MKRFKYYLSIWFVLLLVFNVSVFLMRFVVFGEEVELDFSFWIAWVFVIVSFVVNLACAYYSLSEQNRTKIYYGLPLISISWTAMIILLVIATPLMIIPDCPAWIVYIVCLLVIAISIAAILKALWANEAVEEIDEKTESQTAFIRGLYGQAERIQFGAKSEAVKAECKKVYEAIRYSDPRSIAETSVIEAKLIVKLDEFSQEVALDNSERVLLVSNELQALIRERNEICKASK